MKRERKKIALLIETSNPYARGILKGIQKFQQRQGEWLVFIPEQERGATPPGWLRRWNCDGIIARIENEAIAKSVKEYGVPTVDVSAAQLIDGLPWVETDDQAIGEMAAEHLMQKGFEHFAFYDVPGFNWSRWRMDAFRGFVEELGFACSVFHSAPAYSVDYSWANEFDRLTTWLHGLPKPVGIMACYDIKARQILEACYELGIAVPEQVAVIGVDNDPLICEACHPPLTSISLDSESAGFQAASILNQMMKGQEIETHAVKIAPVDIEERLSTDTIAVDDPEVAAALQFIRENATENIRVSDVLRHVDVSRRKLENRFRKVVGRTPHEEIQYRRFKIVKNLLAHQDLSVAKIAALTGFAHAEYLSVAFQRETGQTISEFRRKMQERSPGKIGER